MRKQIPKEKTNKDPSTIISPTAKTKNQKRYIRLMQDLDMVICDGPAGTGKTHLAVGQGVFDLRHNYCHKMIVARPALEAGESIGYSPGNIDEKMEPYVRPILDELKYFMYDSEIREYRFAGLIEIVPIAYMRGRTFKDAFIICDECQNLTFDQMKMLLTRFGTDSRMVMTGDTAQSDLEFNKQGAFRYACELFKTVDEIGTVTFDNSDIQRHHLVGKIMEIWEKHLDKFKEKGTI